MVTSRCKVAQHAIKSTSVMRNVNVSSTRNIPSIRRFMTTKSRKSLYLRWFGALSRLFISSAVSTSISFAMSCTFFRYVNESASITSSSYKTLNIVFIFLMRTLIDFGRSPTVRTDSGTLQLSLNLRFSSRNQIYVVTPYLNVDIPAVTNDLTLIQKFAEVIVILYVCL